MGNVIYNGISLPDIDEVWVDKETYPYAFIVESGVSHRSDYTLYLVDSPVYFQPTGDSSANNCIYPSNVNAQYTYFCHLVGDYNPDGTITWDLTAENADFSGIVVYDRKIIWVNTDMLNVDGTLYLAASDPIPVDPTSRPFDLRSWLIGYILGICGKPLPLSAVQELVGYLYNGVRLSELVSPPEGYPYIALCGSAGNTVGAFALRTPMTIRSGGALGSADNISNCTSFAHRYCKFVDSGKPIENPEWGEPGTTNSAGSDIFWTNYDAYKTDGTLYLAASEPVPIYE